MVVENLPAWAVRLRDERRKRLWSQKVMATQLIQAADVHIRLPSRESVIRRIRTYEAGQHEPADPYRLLYCRVFGIDEAELFSKAVDDDGGLEARDEVLNAHAQPGEMSSGVEAHREDLSPRLEQILTSWDALMRRRELFPLTGGLAATALISHLPAVASSPPSFSRELYETCGRLTATYRRLDNLLGPHAVFAQAMDHHHRLSSWVRQGTTAAQRRHMARLAIDSGGLTSWLCLDLDHHEQALLLARQSTRIAHESDDVERQAYLIGRMSRILCEGHHYDHALDFADEAVRVAGTSAEPTLRSWLAVTRAYIHACLGNERACRADLTAATKLLDHPSREPEDYIAFHDRGHLYKMTGLSLLKVGTRTATAVSEGRKAIDQAFAIWSQGAVRASAEVLTARASARLAQQEIPEAARLTGEAYAIAVTTRSPRNLRHIMDVRAQLRPYRDTQAVRELDELLGL